MELVLYFKKIGEIEIRLTKAGKLIDALDFSFHGNLDDLLISSVDKVFKRNRIETSSLKTVRIGGDVDKNSSAYKIAQTFIEAIKASKQATEGERSAQRQ